MKTQHSNIYSPIYSTDFVHFSEVPETPEQNMEVEVSNKSRLGVRQKLNERSEYISRQLKLGRSLSSIARSLGVCLITLNRWLNPNKLLSKRTASGKQKRIATADGFKTLEQRRKDKTLINYRGEAREQFKKYMNEIADMHMKKTHLYMSRFCGMSNCTFASLFYEHEKEIKELARAREEAGIKKDYPEYDKIGVKGPGNRRRNQKGLREKIISNLEEIVSDRLKEMTYTSIDSKLNLYRGSTARMMYYDKEIVQMADEIRKKLLEKT